MSFFLALPTLAPFQAILKKASSKIYVRSCLYSLKTLQWLSISFSIEANFLTVTNLSLIWPTVDLNLISHSLLPNLLFLGTFPR